LQVQTDWRLPEHRRKVFLDFYEFHLKYRSHPGCVYYLMPYLRQHYEWNTEEALWYAFLNGNTQHPVTSLLLHQQYPTPGHAGPLLEHFYAHYEQYEFDTDRRYHKKPMWQAVKGYLEMLGGRTQEEFWNGIATGGFGTMWQVATAIPTFGRLSAFSYLEYVRIMGVPFDCDTLFLNDMSGSKSHRNGLCFVSGQEQYDWHSSNPGFDGKYSPELLSNLEGTAASLLAEMRTRAEGQPYAYDVSYFTLESTLCTYKSWHRPNRRYPNVYNDMLFNRIRKSEANWPEKDLSIFWQARADCLPAYLRLEEMPHDPGLSPNKQNHYRLTGEVVMMDKDYPEYANAFNRAVDSGELPRRKDT
jgi:hypothetical protein